MPSGHGRASFRGRSNVMSLLAEQCGISRSRMIVKPRLIDLFRVAPSSHILYQPTQHNTNTHTHARHHAVHQKNKNKKPAQSMHQPQGQGNDSLKEIIFPEDCLYPSLYKRLPILQLEVGVNPHISFGIGQGTGRRPLLAQRIVRRQQQYMDSGMPESQAWKEARNDFNDELNEFRRVVRGDEYKEELSAYLTANLGTLTVKHQEWVERMASMLTGKRFETVKFVTREDDGLPTVRELVDKAIPKVYDDDLSLDGDGEEEAAASTYRYIPEHQRIREQETNLRLADVLERLLEQQEQSLQQQAQQRR